MCDDSTGQTNESFMDVFSCSCCWQPDLEQGAGWKLEKLLQDCLFVCFFKNILTKYMEEKLSLF